MLLLVAGRRGSCAVNRMIGILDYEKLTPHFVLTMRAQPR